eukprot:GHVT01078601.1.p1 GENE.GHVT01078601.1~~GHVT01078601.1.p1  ORF type:complete len:244 (+),score=51.10 GHVT01078601.1:264-995(+)
MQWRQALLIAGGGIAAAGVLYYLLRDDGGAADEGKEEGTGKKLDIAKFNQKEVLEILKAIQSSQDKMKDIMKDLIKEILEKKLDFEATYRRVLEVQPRDPLEEYGLHMDEFDQLLEKFQHEPNVRDAIVTIMGHQPSTPPTVSISKDKVLEVHEFMQKELKKLVVQFQQQSDTSHYEMKNVTIAAQALVGARVQETFAYSSEDMEGAVMLHHRELSVDPRFSSINVEIQGTMTQLMGSQFPTL